MFDLGQNFLRQIDSQKNDHNANIKNRGYFIIYGFSFL